MAAGIQERPQWVVQYSLVDTLYQLYYHAKLVRVRSLPCTSPDEKMEKCTRAETKVPRQLDISLARGASL
jgi:hypothetical protein